MKRKKRRAHFFNSYFGSSESFESHKSREEYKPGFRMIAGCAL